MLQNTYYRLSYRGAATSLNLGNTVLVRDRMQVFAADNLPVSMSILSRIPGLVIEGTEDPSLPGTNGSSPVEVKKTYGVGIVWTGPSPVKANEYGVFKRNEPRYDLPPEVVEEICSGFRLFQKVV